MGEALVSVVSTNTRHKWCSCTTLSKYSRTRVFLELSSRHELDKDSASGKPTGAKDGRVHAVHITTGELGARSQGFVREVPVQTPTCEGPKYTQHGLVHGGYGLGSKHAGEQFVDRSSSFS